MDEARYWQAVLERDASFDTTFVYAVCTTGIYCRPSCSSRRAKRKHVVFFDKPSSAEQAQFRACLRCHPNKTAPDDQGVKLIQHICQLLEESTDKLPTLAELSVAVHVSPFHLQRTFKRIMGITPRQYADACRVDRFKAQLRKGVAVTHALYDAGYGSSSRVYEQTVEQLGMTPTTYRKRGQGMHINYTVVDCQLGRLLVAATERGICAVSIGDNDDQITTMLHNEYPAADIQQEPTQFDGWVTAIVEHLAGQQPHLTLPLDLQATAFQRQVWDVLRTIPYGTTASYSEVARKLGQPKATRAVARACATNPAALVIPCHRVVREDGGLGGYRWGIERKQAILAAESHHQTHSE